MSFWIPRVVMCDDRVLSLKFCPIAEWFELDNLHLVSQHLARLELFGHSSTTALAARRWNNLRFTLFVSSSSLQPNSISLSHCFSTSFQPPAN